MKKKLLLLPPPKIVILIIASALFTALYIHGKIQAKVASQENWQFLIADQVGAQSILNVGKNISFDEQSIFFSDGKGLIHSLNKRSGRVNWTTQIENHSPFTITHDESYIYVSSFDRSIYKIQKKDGLVAWKFTNPNFFWPDTEVVFDENDQCVFFADRGGFLYAIDKVTGTPMWQKKLDNIDNSKIFVEGSIHFGFLYQTDQHLLVDHFPSSTIYTIDKQSGETISQKQSALKINIEPQKDVLFFQNKELRIKNNVISQPKLELVDKNQELIWSYQTEHRVNANEIYQDGERIYYLSANNTILESINSNGKNPNQSRLKKRNFRLTENFAVHHPFQNSNPQVDVTYHAIKLPTTIKKKIEQLSYTLHNIVKLFSFSVDTLEKKDFIELTLTHEDNFYRNKFIQVNIEAIFTHAESGVKKRIKGFYYDKNTWKVRVKLEEGKWNYQIKIRTPFWQKKIKDSMTVKNKPKDRLTIIGNGFATKNKLFLPIGLQDTIRDLNRDGNPLNDMGLAMQANPPTQVSDYKFTDLDTYLDIYKEEASVNTLRYGPDNWAPSIWKDLSSYEDFAMDISGNLQGDAITTLATEKDYRVMMSIFAFYPPYISDEAIAKKANRRVLMVYLDYVIARYGAMVDIWEIANEALPSLAWQNFISDYLHDNDPYKHPITTSLEEVNLNNSELLSIHYYPHEPKNNRELIEQIEKIDSEYNWSKAKIISEFGFAKVNHFLGSADVFRKHAWIAAMQKIGFISWNTGYGLFEHPLNGNIYLGPNERNYLKVLSDLIPPLSTTAISEKRAHKNANLVLYGLKDEQHEIYYLIKADFENQSIDTNSQLTMDFKRNATLQFYNPSTGHMIKKLFVHANNSTPLFLPWETDDLVIKITYQ